MAGLHNLRSFLACERAQLGPAEDLPTMMIMIILLVIFLTGAAHSYDTFNEKREIMDKAEAGLNFLDTLKNNVLADKSSGDEVKPGLIYVGGAADAAASVKIDPEKILEDKVIQGTAKRYYFYAASNPFKLGDASESIQGYWNRMYLYEVIIKDEVEDKVYVFHGGWATKFSTPFTPDGEAYDYIFDSLVNQRLDVVALELPVAIRYGDDFPVEALRGQIRAGKIEVLIW